MSRRKVRPAAPRLALALLALGVLSSGLLLGACGPSSPSEPARTAEHPARPEARYWATQLHLHGSFSEGLGTMADQTEAARRLGSVDVLWWTDHDWRIARHTFVSSFGFESLRQRLEIPHRGMPWSKRPRYIRIAWKALAGGAALAAADQALSDTAAEGQHSLRLGATAGAGEEEWGWTGGKLDTNGGRWSRSLAAGVTLELAVRPETALGADAQLLVRTELSYRAGGTSELRYVVGDEGEARNERIGGRMVGIVPLEAVPGRWTTLRLPVSEDAARLGLGGDDNSLRRIEIRLQTRRGARAAVLVDDLELHEQLDGPALLRREQEMATELGAASGLTEHVGLELSYSLHMNAFLPEIELPDFERFPHGMEPSQAVRWAHERGGLIAYNHVFGAGDDPEDDVKEALAGRGDLVVEERAFGADLLEVGYPLRVLPLADHLAVWDRLSTAGVVITGIGTSDSHDPREGWKDGNNFVSWIWARSPGAPDLIEGLRCGRVFFGDPASFSGTLELSLGELGADAETVTGKVVAGSLDAALTLHAVATDLPPGSRVRWVADGRAIREEMPPAGAYSSELELTPDLLGDADGSGATHFVRLEVWQGERGLAFTNPVYLAGADFEPVLASGEPVPLCRRTGREGAR